MDLRPSSSDIWTQCDAMPLMASRVPEEVPDDPAREGTCAAWVAEMVLTGAVSCAEDMAGKSHENGWLVEPDMVQHIQRYVDHVRSYGGEIHTERKVRLNKHIAGTPDAFAVVTDAGQLIVDDLKYGFGIVEPYENTQVSIYTGAIIRYLAARNVIIRNVTIGIYQPRAWHPKGIYRKWVAKPETIMAFVHTIEAAGERCQNPMPVATPGVHCRYCPAAATCSTVTHENYRVHDTMAARDQRHMSEIEMAAELAFIERAEAMLKGRKSAVTAEAEARIKHGQMIPGWSLQSNAGQRRFTQPREIIYLLTGIDPRSDKMVTPLELERRGASVDTVAKLTETPRTKPTLKPVGKQHFIDMFPPHVKTKGDNK